MTTAAQGSTPAPGIPGALQLSDEAKAQFREQLAAAEASPESKAMEAQLGAAIDKRDDTVRRELLGTDLDFDPKAFIIDGVISRKGIEVKKGVYVDMHTLTTKERMLAEAMVRDHWGNMKLDNVYLTAIEAAMVAVAITRINNQPFENPDISKGVEDKENQALYAGKRQLFQMFMDAGNEFVTMLSVLYRNLEAVPTEDVIKKS